MATYKVLQDIEAEDTLIGPLTLRQCIYAAIAAISIYLSVIAVTKHAAFLVAFFLPLIGFGVFFAFPWRKEQSTEVWALAKIRFSLKPRKRIWDQSGVKDLVTVTAPKQLMDPRLQHRMSETEVQSRLKALAATIDSRGWAVKNVPLNMFVQPQFQPASDRLVEAASLPRDVPAIDTAHTADMFDLDNNPLAQQFQAKMTASSTAHHQQLVQQIDNPAAAAQPAAPTNWYAGTAGPRSASVGSMVPAAADPTPEELAVINQVKQRQELLHTPVDNHSSHMRTIQPLSVQNAQAAAEAQAAQSVQPATVLPAASAAPAQAGTLPAAPAQAALPPVTPTPNPAILELANNNDLNVAAIAHEAKRRNPDGSDEVVVTLH